MKKAIIILVSILFTGMVSAQENCFENCRKNFENSELDFPIKNDSILQRLIGCKLPNFEAKTITGKFLSLKNLTGKVIVLNFSFATCPPCVDEVPSLNKLIDEYKGKDVVFISFSRDMKPEAKEFVRKTGFKYNVIANYPNAELTFCIIGGWPMNMVIDKNGILRLVCNSRDVYNKIKQAVELIY